MLGSGFLSSNRCWANEKEIDLYMEIFFRSACLKVQWICLTPYGGNCNPNLLCSYGHGMRLIV
jgi:hypothetical protein